MKIPVLVLMLALCMGGSGAMADAGDLIFFRAEWDGGADAVLQGARRAPAVAEQAAWGEPSGGGHALTLSPGTRLAYELGEAFPGMSGALALRIRPGRPPNAQCEVLRLDGADDFSIALAFVPAGPRWVFLLQGRGGRAEIAAWRNEIKYEQWNHLLLTWGDDGVAALYVDGKWLRSQPFAGRMAGPARLALDGVPDMDIEVGPVLIFNRCFTPPQAELLAQLAGRPAAERLARIQEQIRADDQAMAQRFELVARLRGRVGRVYHTRGRESGPVPLPEGIMAEGIRPEDLGVMDLSRFAVIYFPQGPNFQIQPEQYSAIQDFVKKGGGYVGDCQGAYFAAEKLQLLPITCYQNNIWGLYKIHVKPHFVTDNRSGEITMHFGNGPIMAPGADCTVLANYAMKLPGDIIPAAIIAGKYGAGRVVLFGPHPLGEKVAFKGTSAHFSGKLLGTERMFVNALLLAAGMVDEHGTPR